ncbi:MAG: aldehyde dehydrogenase family protein [bacterium]|jgi:aldehyde dehydrogenase (NAD+)|nr:aldehyde dehydrogenase family protein [bacterium]
MKDILAKLGIEELNQGASTGSWITCKGNVLESASPIDGKVLAGIQQCEMAEYEQVMRTAEQAFREWRMWPAPRRGEIVRQLGEELRAHKEELAALVTLEMGKVIQEGRGEVQEMIDICDFATGMSRQLYGVTTHSERARHRMFEQWHPLGIIGVITAFNFPVAVWSWNTALALICGDVVVWKPSSKTPLTAVACQKIAERVLKRNGVPDGVCSLIIGKGSSVGDALVRDTRVPLISATGSTPMGKRLAAIVGERLGRTILELGGNNAIIVTPNADLSLAIPNIAFGAIGTAGQRCTSTRRIIVHESLADTVIQKLAAAYQTVKIGNPLVEGVLMGPLVDAGAVKDLQSAIAKVKAEGGQMICGGELLAGPGYESGCYVTPAIAKVRNEMEIVQEETFAPLLYIIPYSGGIEEAIALQNGVPQGLSSGIFTNHVIESETFLSAMGSDCGIANVNLGTSGAEIGLAFGGEKDTGGGRESGSDVWKYYMRRQSNTVNWSGKTAFAQGINFEL